MLFVLQVIYLNIFRINLWFIVKPWPILSFSGHDHNKLFVS